MKYRLLSEPEIGNLISSQHATDNNTNTSKSASNGQNNMVQA